jgi:sec-independent protein translocase protein TatA
MFHGLTGWHLVILLLVILLLFGAAKLPALAKSVGQSARVLKGEMKAMKADDAPDAATDPQPSPVTATSSPAASPKPHS